jgi:hypothetical protein
VHHQRMLLERLRATEVQEIIEAVAGEANLTPAIIEKISSRTEGVPLSRRSSHDCSPTHRKAARRFRFR